MLDISEYPLLDGHCHAFLPEKEEEGLDQSFNLSFLQIPDPHNTSTLLFRRVVTELARVLDCDADWATVAEARAEAYGRDPSAYIGKLFREAGLKAMLVDQGYPCEEFNGYSVPLSGFADLLGGDVAVHPLFRIEPVLAELFRTASSFDELLSRFGEALEQAVQADGCVGFKSIIAYVFGLRVEKIKESEARRAYTAASQSGQLTKSTTEKDWIPNDGANIRDERILRNYLLWKAFEKSIELSVPFQLHTGIGDSPFIDVRAVNPLHLLEVIADEQLREAEIVIVHSGYPYVREAGFLANNYPNVYIDLSEMIPFASIGGKDCILQLLEMAPVTKLMYGSDGFGVPEIFWIGGLVGREALSRALQELVESRAIDEEYAHEMARLILHANAVRLYGLGE